MPARNSPAIDRELITRLAAEHPGWTQRELAARAACSRNTVARVLQDAEAPPPGRYEQPCPLCRKPLKTGASHFVRVHGMTAREVRRLTGMPTVNPRLSALIARELCENTPAPRWTDGAILEAISSFYRRTGNAPGTRTWDRAGASHPGTATVKRRFGSWSRALAAAGVPKRRQRAFRMSAARRAGYARRCRLVVKTCPACGERFEKRPSESGQVACSRICGDLLRRKLPDATCPGCGMVFHPRDHGQTYCSLSCRRPTSTPGRAAYWASMRGRRSDWVTKTCPICGTVFERNPARAHEEGCSRSCGQQLRWIKRGRRGSQAGRA